MRLTAISLLLINLSLLTAGCTQANTATKSNEAPTDTLTVFTAASLTEAFTEIGKSFEETHSGTQVLFNFAGSQQLAQQLAQGAPADAFASADEQQMMLAVQTGRVREGEVQIFARNHLVVIFPTDNPGGITRLGDLAEPGLMIVLANQAVPVGNYSLEFLNKASQHPEFGLDYKNKVLKSVVSYEENVKAVLSNVLLGEADAGIVYASDLSPTNGEKLGYIEIPDPLNVTAGYFIAPVGGSSESEPANDFINFVLSTQGQDILAQHGLIPAQ